MKNDFSIPREILQRMLGNPRAVASFERMGVVLSETSDATTANVAETQTLKDAAFVTLSANAELPNERVLKFGPGLRGDVTTGAVMLQLDRNIPQATGGFSVQFVAAGDSQLGLPPAGTLATQEWVNAQGFGTGVNVRSVTGTVSVLSTDAVLLADASGGAVTVNLPAAASSANRTLYIKKIDASGNTVTLDGNASETIDGAGTKAIIGQYDSVTIVCDGAEWWVL